MKNLFIPYELALIAKEKGFNEPCLGRYLYDNGKYIVQISPDREDDLPELHLRDVKAPLYQQIVDWFQKIDSIYIVQIPTLSKLYEVYSIDSGNKKTEICTGLSFSQAIEEAFKLI